MEGINSMYCLENYSYSFMSLMDCIWYVNSVAIAGFDHVNSVVILKIIFSFVYICSLFKAYKYNIKFSDYQKIIIYRQK